MCDDDVAKVGTELDTELDTAADPQSMITKEIAQRHEAYDEGRRSGAPQEIGKASFFTVSVFARGLLDRLFTRASVPGRGLIGDALLGSLSPARRDTLVAMREPDGALRFDIRLHGADETVFLTFDDCRFAGRDGVGA